MWKLSWIILGGPESSFFDLTNILRGTLFSTYTMWDEVSAFNLIKAAPVLQVPLFFLSGATTM